MYKENHTNQIYTTSSYNEYMINYLNPFHPMFNMVVTIHHPILPDLTKEVKKEIPDVNLRDIFVLMPHFRDELEKMNDVYIMFEYLLALSKKMVSYEVVADKDIYKYLVSLHTAHHISQHIRDLKDEANLISLNDEDVEKNYYIKDMSNLLEKGVKDSFYLTNYGKRFLEIYVPMLEWSFKGSISRRRTRGR